MTTIHVSQADIDRGISMSCGKCPIALAINRVIAPQFKARAAHVIEIVSLRIFGDCIIQAACHHTRETGLFMGAFDNGRAVSPFSFDLDIPERLLKAV